MDRMEFLKQIQSRQKKVEDQLLVDHNGGRMKYLNHGQSPYYNPCVYKTDDPDDLSPGCKSCKDGTWWCLYVGHRCNLDCIYCPQGTAEDKRECIDHPEAMQRLWIRDIKLALQAVKPGTIKGISYSGGEPLMFIEKILDMGQFVSENFPDIYQWCYTNGLLVNEYRLDKLVDVGLSEIRFHIGASKFNKDVIAKLPMAAKRFKRLTVETPANLELRQWAIKEDGLKKLVDMGVTQINCAEHYYMNQRCKDQYPDQPSYWYTSMTRGRHESPIFSRHVTYDIIDYVIKHNLKIIVNDCNHESRDAQLQTRELNRDRLAEMY